MARSLWRSTLVVSFMTMLSRILGLVRDVALLNVFGAGGMMDAFLVAFKIPNFFRRLFAEGAFANAFVPVLTEYKTRKSLQEVQLLISKTSGALTLILSLMTIVAILAAHWVIVVFAPGFQAMPEKFTMAVELLRITFPYLILMSLTAFSGSVLQTYGSFATASFSPVLLNLCMIAGALLFAPMMQQPIMALGWAVFISGILQLAIQLPEMHKRKLLVSPTVDFKDEGVRKILKLMIPALFGVSVVQINLLLNSIWASKMIDGSVTWLYTAERMTELPLGLIGIAISSVILPSLSARHAEKNHEKFKAMLDWATQVIMLVGIPASIAMWMLAEPIVQVVYQHGHKVSPFDVQMTAWALGGMSASVLAFMLIKIFAPGFYAQQNTKTPVKIGMISVATNIILNIVLIRLFHHFNLTQGEHVCLALSSSFAACLNAYLLYRALSKQGIFKLGSHWKKVWLRYVIANLCMIAFLAWGVPHLFDSHAEFWLRLVQLALLCVGGACVYFMALLAVGFRFRHIKQSA